MSNGIIVTNNGYTDAAIERAQNDSHDVDLRIIEFKYLSAWHSLGGGIAWHGPMAALVRAPDTWVIDNQRSPKPFHMSFSMYPLGYTRETALRFGAFIYGNFELKSMEHPSMESIARRHEKAVLEGTPSARFEYLPPIARSSGERTLYRVGDIHLDTLGASTPSTLTGPKAFS